VDETSLGLGKALAIARDDTIHIGHPLVPELPNGTLDPDWIPVVASKGLIVIGRDKHIRTRPGERELLQQHGLRVFRIAGKKDMKTWGYLERLVRHWDAMESAVVEKGPGPWFVAINDSGLSDIPI